MPDAHHTARVQAATPSSVAALLFVLLLLCASSAEAQSPRKMRDVTPEERAAWRGLLRWPETCETEYQATYGAAGEQKFGGVVFHPLGRGRRLVEVTCDGGGVQPSSVFMLYEGRRARTLRLKGFDGEEEVRAVTGFDKRKRELFLLSKADAMGTCGLFVRYSFTNGRPRVVEARRQDDCGRPGGSPDTDRWPRVRLKG
jgi:hypothetical protein